MKKITIYDIKRGHDGHFFDRDTLKFFKQTLKDFSVYKQGNDVFKTVAPCQFGESIHYWRAKPLGVFELLGTKYILEKGEL
jgi:hypothetical protein